MVPRGPVRYATSGDLRIAYQAFGEGDVDVIMVPGFVSNLDLMWELSAFGPVLQRLGEVARGVVFDKRGTGLSDRELGFGSLEERMDDLRAVMDAVGLERAKFFGVSEGGPLSLAFAATYPDRAEALALYGAMPRAMRAPDFPSGIDPALTASFLEELERRWGTGRAMRAFVQHIPKTPEVQEAMARYERSACTPRQAVSILEQNLSFDIRPILSTVTASTLILHSTGDPMIPVESGRVLADLIPGARLVEHDADYHMTYDGANAWFLDPVIEFLVGERHAPLEPTDRILATVLFTDIVGSTQKAAAMGDRRWRELLDRHDSIASEQVKSCGGRVVKTTGDGVLATLDGPSRAVECAVAIRNALRSLELDMRAGVHTGEVERRGDDIGGIGVNIGSRIAGLAGPGEVWVSRTVKDLTAGSDFRFEERGRHALKGVPDEWDLFSFAP